MKRIKEILFAVVSLALVAAISVGATVAYLTSEDSDVNVMTMGNVKIEQLEYQRVVENGAWVTAGETDKYGYTPDKLQEFAQAKPLIPAVFADGIIKWDDRNGSEEPSGDGSHQQSWGQIGAPGSIQLFDDSVKNVQDKFVFVKNTGKSDAYVRTWIALEQGSIMAENFKNVIMTNSDGIHWSWEVVATDVVIDGNEYYVLCATYLGPTSNPTGILAPSAVSYPSLLQVYMTPAATNEDMENIDGNGNDTYDILVFSQAVQAAGFENATAALNAAFGEAVAANHPWTEPIQYPGYVYNETQLKEALAAGSAIKLGADFTVSETVNVPANVTINGEGFTLSRADGFTGTMFNVQTGAALTLENITVDGGAIWTGAGDATLLRGTVNNGVTATGNIVAAGTNSRIILNEDAILQNNDGAHAVNLGTRIGATLTLNGGQIINNNSGSGAIWGGGHIIVNDGKINGNSSTGLAGAIRMVGNCNLTINGGEMNHNKAAGDGGAIWGYGSSTYTFTGGEMAYNESAGVGGAIYTGTYSKIDISGDFGMHDNKASNTGAIRLTDHTSMNMTGGKVYGNTQNGTSNAFNTWNNSISITGGELQDNMSFVGGLGLTIGNADIDGVIAYDLSTNHNTAYLAADFNGFKFTVNESDEHFANFNFKPAAGYTYTAGDEAKLVCQNEGYATYWDAASGTFKLEKKAFVSSAADLKTALENGGKVVLEQDIVLTEEVNITNAATILLNGKNLTVSRLEAKADTSISGGTITHGKNTCPALSVSAGTLTMTDVTVYCAEPCNIMTNNAGTLEAAEYSALEVWSGKCVLNNCNITALSDKVRFSNSVFAVGIHAGELTVNGGSIHVSSAESTRANAHYVGAVFAGSDTDKVINLNDVAITMDTDAKLLFAWGGNTVVNTTDENGTWDSMVNVNGGTYEINYK